MKKNNTVLVSIFIGPYSSILKFPTKFGIFKYLPTKNKTMKSINYLSVLLLSTCILLCLSCKSEKDNEDKKDLKIEKQEQKDEVIEIVTNVMDFVTKDTVPSGWNTFKYINKSNEPHFILFDDYPEDKGAEDAQAEVGPAFDKGMKLINEGKMEEAMQAFGELPEWFGEIVFTGGSGLISPGEENTFTLKLRPGNYIIECYVKMANGVFHTSMGMTKEIWVENKDSGLKPPNANVNLTISSTEGITYNGDIKSGKTIFQVDYKDQIVHENFVGHDINLVRLNENANLDNLEAWMNWATPTGLMTPAPQGITFMGGTNDAPAGSTQYFEVDLSPGNYAFISEVPNSKAKGMLKTFKVE